MDLYVCQLLTNQIELNNLKSCHPNMKRLLRQNLSHLHHQSLHRDGITREYFKVGLRPVRTVQLLWHHLGTHAAHGKSIGANNSFAQHRRFVLLTLSSRGMFFKFRLFATLLFDRRFRYLICVAFFDSMSSRKSYGLSFRFCGTHT